MGQNVVISQLELDTYVAQEQQFLSLQDEIAALKLELEECQRGGSTDNEGLDHERSSDVSDIEAKHREGR
jgi:hypothetical protein